MNWAEFEKNVRNQFSETYNIEICKMDSQSWDNVLLFLKEKEYLISYSTVEQDIISNVTGETVINYFKTGTTYWPCIILSIHGFRLDGFIKSDEKLEFWFNDSQETLLDEKSFNSLLMFMNELGKSTNKKVQFVNEDTVNQRLIFEF